MSMRCSIIPIQSQNAVRIEIEKNDFGENETLGGSSSYSLIINGRDEDRVTKAFITIANLFPKAFESENSHLSFPETISTFDEILDHPRSFGMGFHWTISP